MTIIELAKNILRTICLHHLFEYDFKFKIYLISVLTNVSLGATRNDIMVYIKF